jgi:putative serine protease PepD
MSSSDTHGRNGRRALWVAAPFTIGALAGGAIFASWGGTTTSAAPASATLPVGSSAVHAAVARVVTPRFDAQTIYARDSPGVVDITVTEPASQGGLSPFVPGGSGPAQAEGTGFVYDKAGDIITADHVVAGATKISVRFKDGTTAKATLVGADPSSDTAVIKVGVDAAKLTPLALADSAAVVPGEGVVAIGSPFGYAESITAGIVSAVARTISAPNGYSIPNAIQTDAAINHGNSGGPLIDSSGDVVGINVQIATDSQSSVSDNAGVGFAVPSNTVKTVVSDLIAGKPVRHPYLGISVGDASSRSGATVGSVRAGSPAAAAGLKVGDIIVAIDGKPITGADQLTGVVSEHQPGDKISITVDRKGATVHLEATLGTRPASSSA